MSVLQETPLDILDNVLDCFYGVRPYGHGFLALCSAHDDTHQSLSIRKADDRVLLHCWAGCRTSDVLDAVGLGYRDLFAHEKSKATNRISKQRGSESLPYWYWNWRKKCAAIECAISEKRDNAEAVLSGMSGLDINALTDAQFDDVMCLVGQACDWLDRCDRLDEMLYLLQQTLREEERQ